jgi:DHA2 family multidrug resistance protein
VTATRHHPARSRLQPAHGADHPDDTLPPPTGQRGIPYHWVAMSVILIGTFMAILDTSIVNVALPQIGADFHSESAVDWIVTSYLLAVGVSILASGWLADNLGKKRVFVASLVLFTIGSALCAISPTLVVLVVARVAQGLGGGAILPIGMAMIYELFEPQDRGTALGIWGVAAMAAPAVGPVLGGFLVSSVDWRVLFLINLPVGLVAIPLASRLLREVAVTQRRPLDVPGLALAAAGLVAVLLALSEAPTWGWTAVPFLVTITAGVVALAIWVWRSLHIRAPIIELRMFRIPIFSLTIVIVWLITIAQFTRLVFVPLEFEALRGVSALSVGLMLTPAAVGVALTMPVGGRLADRVGARVPVTIGLGVLALSFWPLAHLGLHTPLWEVAVVLFVGGLGTGLSVMPNTVVAMNSVHGRYVAQASAVRSLNRQVAGAFGTAAMASILASGSGPVGTDDFGQLAGYNELFLIAFVVTLLAFVCAFALPGRRVARELQEARRDDVYSAEAFTE